MASSVTQRPGLQVARFDPSRAADFYAVHSAANGADWCYCTAWWTPTWDGWGDRSAEENLQLRSELLQRGEYDGYLLYVHNRPVGWCQVGPRDRLAKLVEQFRLQPNPGACAVTCFLIAPAYRRKGLSSYMLDVIIDDLRKSAVRRIEAFPRRGPELDVYELWNGPEEMFLSAGFEVVKDDPIRPLLALDLQSEATNEER